MTAPKHHGFIYLNRSPKSKKKRIRLKWEKRKNLAIIAKAYENALFNKILKKHLDEMKDDIKKLIFTPSPLLSLIPKSVPSGATITVPIKL